MIAQRQSSRRQRGITMFGLLFWAIVIGVLALVGMRVVPTAVEYYTIMKAINKITAEEPGTVPQIRAAFERTKAIDLITSIGGKDLDITKENEKVVISFAYNSEIELVKPVYLVIKYEGRSKGGKSY
ncbi:MAG: membrane protein [Methylibium sp. NZG]|nr:MAG: membrane protein [Methylibium sp. NZG]